MKGQILLTGVAAFFSIDGMAQHDKQPNIVLIMVDDMGYSDLGCYGGEIKTPNLDRLAKRGVRYTNFYNTSRSCPSRASLLTGLYAHQTGVGLMAEDPHSNLDRGVHGYRGFLNKNCVTLGEVLRESGYHTYMVGKWHVGMHGQEKWPLQRGFDHYYGILSGAANYLCPHGDRNLTLDNEQLPPPEQPYYITDAFTDYALKFVKERPDDNAPFFLYMAYNAPHWPLQAKQKDIDKFIGKYKKGWQKVREARLKRMISMGLAEERWGSAQWEGRQWDELTGQEQKELDLRMSVYAAQVHCVDYNVGRVVDYLEKTGELDNTLIVFLSDNGGAAEPYNENGSGTVEMINNLESWNKPSYGLPWSQVSNTPFRKYKERGYEGGASTPFIISWPEKHSQFNGELRHNRAFLPDIMATFIEASGTTYPKTFHGGSEIIPLQGTSLLPTMTQPDLVLHEYIFGEHNNNNVIWWNSWKAVKDRNSLVWELFDIKKDRTERVNLINEYPEILKDMVAKWTEWANTHNVFPKTQI